jgi:hypothetical protein
VNSINFGAAITVCQRKGVWMEKEASAVLGEPIVEVAILLKRGAVKNMRMPIGGLVGILASKLRKDTTPIAPAPNGYDGGGLLALTDTRLALFALEQGFAKHSLGELLAEFLPGQLDRFEFGKAAVGMFTLDLVSVTGDRWAFEGSAVLRKKLNRMAEASNALVVN